MSTNAEMLAAVPMLAFLDDKERATLAERIVLEVSHAGDFFGEISRLERELTCRIGRGSG
jgi:hypothetical protein